MTPFRWYGWLIYPVGWLIGLLYDMWARLRRVKPDCFMLM